MPSERLSVEATASIWPVTSDAASAGSCSAMRSDWRAIESGSATSP